MVDDISKKRKCKDCGNGGAVGKGRCIPCLAKNLGKFPEPDFTEEKGQQYILAPEAHEIATLLVPEFHKHLLDLAFRVEYIFIKNTPKKGGKLTLGRVKLVSGLNAWLADPEKESNPTPDPFFVIEFSHGLWKMLKPASRFALVDHELSHCGANEYEKACRLPHDCEEFNAITRRHGLWMEDLKELVAAAKEFEEDLPLYPNEEEEASAAAAAGERE